MTSQLAKYACFAVCSVARPPACAARLRPAAAPRQTAAHRPRAVEPELANPTTSSALQWRIGQSQRGGERARGRGRPRERKKRSREKKKGRLGPAELWPLGFCTRGKIIGPSWQPCHQGRRLQPPDSIRSPYPSSHGRNFLGGG